jgi:hypothetical protein
MITKLFAIGLFALTASAIVYLPSAANLQTSTIPIPVKPTVVPSTPKRIQAVFVLDTTGSMGGLIQAAKDKIWSIATTMASAQPAPEIEIGLVAYRDRGDAYVTRVVDLSTDLDSVYATLIDFEAGGGGDGPESVNAALYDAVHRVSWNQDHDTYRVVFLVGDAPAHMDYQDDVPYTQSLAVASARGIVVNTIRCGDVPDTEAQWRQIAALAQGEYFSVAQAGSAIAIATPFDEDLARLSRELDDTRLVYGDDAVKEKFAAKQSATDKLHALASEASLARRAAFNAMASGVKNLFGDNDLVADVAAGRVDLDDVAPEALPAALQPLAPAERQALVADQAKKRDEIQAEIKAIGVRRDAYLAEEVAKTEGAASSLDYRLYETVRAQAGKLGLDYAEAPKL